MELDGQVAVVTGAGKGIGRATALRLARAGATVVGGSRTAEDLDSLVAEVEAAGGRARGVVTDVADRAQAERLIQTAHDEFGQIDILVNSAGTNILAPVYEVTDEQFRAVFEGNLYGVLNCTRAVAPLMMARNSGKIINVASLSSKRANPRRAAYTTAKFAALGLAKATALDLKEYGITVTSILPGPTATSLRGRSAPGEDPARQNRPEAIAEVILFVATRPQEVIIPEISVYPRALI